MPTERHRSSCKIVPLITILQNMKLSKQHAMYESEHTKFIAELKKQHPEMEEGQRAGRALLWDKAPISLAEQDQAAEARVKQQAYVYQNKL